MSTTPSANDNGNTSTTPVATTTSTTVAAGATLLNSRIVGHELGQIKYPVQGDGGIAKSYANTSGSVQLISVGIDTNYTDKLTYEVFDVYGEGGAADPEVVFSGETSVTNWDPGSQTGVVLINATIPCRADMSTFDGSMDLQVVLKDKLKQPVYHNINVPQPESVTEADEKKKADEAKSKDTLTKRLEDLQSLEAQRSRETEHSDASKKEDSTNPPADPESVAEGPNVNRIGDQYDKSDLTRDLIVSGKSRVIFRGSEKPPVPGDQVYVVSQKDVTFTVNPYDEISVSSGKVMTFLSNDVHLTKTTQGTKKGDIVIIVVSDPKTDSGTSSDPGSTYDSGTTTDTGTTPGATGTGTTPDTGTTSDSGVNTYASTTTTAEPTTTTTTTTTAPSTTTTTTTTTTVDPLGETEGTTTTTTTTEDPSDPRLRFDTTTTTTTDPADTETTLSVEDQQALDALLSRARTADGNFGGGTSTTTSTTTTTTVEPTTTTTTTTSTTTEDPNKPPVDPRYTTTTTTEEPATTTTTTTGEDVPKNHVGSQEELLIALETFANIFLTQDFEITDIINVPANVTITGINDPKITMRNTSVAFKVTASNVTLDGFTIQSAERGIKSNGIGVLVTRQEPGSPTGISNVSITNMTFIDIGATNRDLYGAISVRGYSATHSNPKVNDLVPVLFPTARPFTNISIDRCTFTDSGNNAIDFWTVNSGNITNCIINGVNNSSWNRGNGIRGVDLRGAKISNNYIRNVSQVGIKILGSNTTLVNLNDNQIEDCPGVAGVGIMIYYGASSVVTQNNEIQNCTNGILVTGGCTFINLKENLLHTIKNSPLSIGGLSNNIDVTDNEFLSTLGSTVIKVLQTWNVNLQRNHIIDHDFEIGPGSEPKRGILIGQTNGATVANNKIDTVYPSTDDKSGPIYIWRIFPQNPLLSDGKEATPTDNPDAFPWLQYFQGTSLVPGIEGGAEGLKYARKQITSGELIFGQRSGSVASSSAWLIVTSFVNSNVDESGNLLDFTNDSGQVNTSDETQEDYTLTINNGTREEIRVNGEAVKIGESIDITKEDNGFNFSVDLGDDWPGTRWNSTNFAYEEPVWEEEDRDNGRFSVGGYIIEGFQGSVTFSRGRVVDGGDGSADDDEGEDMGGSAEGTTGTTPDMGGSAEDTTSTTDTTDPFWPRIIIIDDDPGRFEIGGGPPPTKTPPPPPTWWWTPPPPYLTPPPPLTGTGGPTLFQPPTGCIEPPIDPPIDKPEEPEDPEIPSTTPPPQEQCVYPAPILPLQPNFYRDDDILLLTSTTTTEPPVDDEPWDAPDIEIDPDPQDVDCEVAEDCNSLSY